MKAISMFIMTLICMVSFTAGATTTKLEQKQKTELVKAFSVETSIVSVGNDYQVVFVETDAKIKTEFKVKSFGQIKPLTFVATIDDVGWRNSRFNYNLNLKSNLPGTYRIPIDANLHNKERVKIRCDC